MTINEIEQIFLQDIGEPYASGDRLTFLRSALSAAADAVQQTGITLDTAGNIPALDANIVRMYAAWLVRGRASREAMPRQLQYMMHSRLFSEKMTETED